MPESHTMQILATTLALASVVTYPIIADATNAPPMSWPAQYTTAGALMALLTYLTTKTFPATIEKIESSHGEAMEKMAASQKECTTELTDNIKGLRTDLSSHLSRHMDLLSDEIKKRPG